jgi:hypothetical protein
LSPPGVIDSAAHQLYASSIVSRRDLAPRVAI